jgi:hypothetical protein
VLKDTLSKTFVLAKGNEAIRYRIHPCRGSGGSRVVETSRENKVDPNGIKRLLKKYGEGVDMEERSLTTTGAPVIHNVRRTYQDQPHGHILKACSRQCYSPAPVHLRASWRAPVTAVLLGHRFTCRLDHLLVKSTSIQPGARR